MTAPAPSRAGVPEWDTADRMRKALRESGVSVEAMAAYLQVSRRSVGNWINGRIDPSVQTLRLWALRTGVPLEWLHHGDADTPCDFRLVLVGSPRDVSAGQGGIRDRANKMQRSRANIGVA